MNFIPPSPRRVIALVGGIASGKSTASKILSQQIIPQYLKTSLESNEIINQQNKIDFKSSPNSYYIDADRIGHSIYVKGKPAYYEVIQCFGENIIDPETGEINRRALGQIVFSNKARMEDLQNIVWPRIQQEIKEILDEIHKGFVVLEAAVLLEAKWYTLVDEIWCLSVDREIAIKRMKQRNGLSIEEAEKRIDSQWTNEQREKFAQVILKTNTEAHTLPSRLEKLFLRRFRSLCLPKLGILFINQDILLNNIDDTKKLINKAVEHIYSKLIIFAFQDPSNSIEKSNLKFDSLIIEYKNNIVHALSNFNQEIEDVKEIQSNSNDEKFEGQIYLASKPDQIHNQIEELFLKVNFDSDSPINFIIPENFIDIHEALTSTCEKFSLKSPNIVSIESV